MKQICISSNYQALFCVANEVNTWEGAHYDQCKYLQVAAVQRNKLQIIHLLSDTLTGLLTCFYNTSQWGKNYQKNPKLIIYVSMKYTPLSEKSLQ